MSERAGYKCNAALGLDQTSLVRLYKRGIVGTGLALYKVCKGAMRYEDEL